MYSLPEICNNMWNKFFKKVQWLLRSVVPGPVVSPGNLLDMQILGPDVELRILGMGLKFEGQCFTLTELTSCMLNCMKLVLSFWFMSAILVSLCGLLEMCFYRTPFIQRKLYKD